MKIHLILDLESSSELAEHRRYQASERYTPQPGHYDSGRRGQRGQEDPLTTPRWPFQAVLAVSESDSLVFNFRLSPYDSSSYHLD
jgi:hypothetical protein